MKIAFIHSDKKIKTGAHYVNHLIVSKLKQFKVRTKNFYPGEIFSNISGCLTGVKKVLPFYALLNHKNRALDCDIIHGTTYTPLPFLKFPIPVVSYFGSTVRGFLKATPRAYAMEPCTRELWYKLKKAKAITSLDIKTRQPLRDIAAMEEYVAMRADAVVVTSNQIKKEITAAGVCKEKVHIIHNAIEDYWFNGFSKNANTSPEIIFLGRIGGDAFTMKLKGVDRLIDIYEYFPKIKKFTFCLADNNNFIGWMNNNIQNHDLFLNVKKNKLPDLLRRHSGGILFVPSRYEGFSLSLVEGMSQGLVPVSYPVGVAPEIIKNGKNGFLIDSQAEAKEKIKILAASLKKRQEMSAAAIETAACFNGEDMAKELINLYENIAESARSCFCGWRADPAVNFLSSVNFGKA